MNCGIGISPGIGIGKALVLKSKLINIPHTTIEDVENEIRKYNRALSIATEQLSSLARQAEKEIGKDEAAIFEAHIDIVNDPEMSAQVKEKIRMESINAESALRTVTDEFMKIFQSMDNAYMKERVHDIQDIRHRLYRIMLGIKEQSLTSMNEDTIIIADDLTPSQMAEMNKAYVKGLITEHGGETSHAAIIARTLQIPAVSGVINALDRVSDGEVIAMDGQTGEFFQSPSETVLNKLNLKKDKEIQRKEKLKELIGKKTISKDGVEVEIAANIGTPQDMASVLVNDAEAIGLYRTEFLFMDRNAFPDEEEQFEAYKIVLVKMEGKPVVIRTLDIGGDKKLDYLEMPDEQNPFLGYRAIRLCLDRIDIFKTQLRALYRASIHGNLKIMFPMISSLEELLAAKAICEDVKDELRGEKKEYSKSVQVGMMIEIPAAALISDILAKEVDFFSIGTNDLIQYTTAVDRMNTQIAKLYSAYHPAVLRLVKMVIDNGHREGIWVGMCGEAAGDPRLVPILLGMGLDEFSMSAGSVLNVRGIIRNLSQEALVERAEHVLTLGTAQAVLDYLESFTRVEDSSCVC